MKTMSKKFIALALCSLTLIRKMGEILAFMTVIFYHHHPDTKVEATLVVKSTTPPLPKL